MKLKCVNIWVRHIKLKENLQSYVHLIDIIIVACVYMKHGIYLQQLKHEVCLLAVGRVLICHYCYLYSMETCM